MKKSVEIFEQNVPNQKTKQKKGERESLFVSFLSEPDQTGAKFHTVGFR